MACVYFAPRGWAPSTSSYSACQSAAIGGSPGSWAQHQRGIGCQIGRNGRRGLSGHLGRGEVRRVLLPSILSIRSFRRGFHDRSCKPCAPPSALTLRAVGRTSVRAGAVA